MRISLIISAVFEYPFEHYLDKKLEEDGRFPPDSTQPDVEADPEPAPQSRINLNLPRDIIESKIGRDNLIMAEYVTEQIFSRIRNHATGFSWEVIHFGF